MQATTPVASAPSLLADPRLRAVLDEGHAAARGDVRLFARAAPRAIVGWLRGQGVEESLRPVLRHAYIPVDRRQGEVLYLLTRAMGARRVVEFGTSFGLSTLYLAAAVRDGGGGEVIGSELEESKRLAAEAALARAGLGAIARVLPGDARASLATVPGPIDLLFLDGWKDLYLPILRLLEPRLRPGAVVVADDTKPFRKRLAPYLAHVRDARRGYLSLDLPLGDGLEVSLRTAPPP